MTGQTVYTERLTHAAARRVRDAGYITSSLNRIDPSTIEYGDAGFAIYKKILHEVKGWFVFIPIRNRQEHLYRIGSLYVYDTEDTNKLRDRWKLNVYGHENVSELSDLVRKIAADHNAGLDIELVEEKAIHFTKHPYHNDWYKC